MALVKLRSGGSGTMSPRLRMGCILAAWIVLVNCLFFYFAHFYRHGHGNGSHEGISNVVVVRGEAPIYTAEVASVAKDAENAFKSFAVDLMSQSKRRGRQSLRSGNAKFDLTIWSSDFHISPVADLKHLLSTYGVRFIDKSLSGHCHLTDTCQKDLHVINRENGIDLGACPNQLRRDFYAAYRNDPEFLSADIILCTHACSMCELFMPFNKTLIVISSTRYEIGRHSRRRWEQWNDNLRRIHKAPSGTNVVAANNAYDQRYMAYFTGIPLSDIKLLPSYCGYIVDRYNPSISVNAVTKDVLIGPSRGISKLLLAELESAELEHLNSKSRGKQRFYKLSPIRSIYPIHHEYSDIVQHPAIVFLPYQVSLMSFFEFYRMNIPLYVPTARLLSDWHAVHGVLNERTWDRVYGHPSSRSAISKALDNGRYEHGNPLSITSDPNNEFNRTAIGEWVGLSDYYQWPHIRQFDSWLELFSMLESDNLHEISRKMQTFNEFTEDHVRREWLTILGKISDLKSTNIGSAKVNLADDINESLDRYYDTKIDLTCINHA